MKEEMIPQESGGKSFQTHSFCICSVLSFKNDLADVLRKDISIKVKQHLPEAETMRGICKP